MTDPIVESALNDLAAELDVAVSPQFSANVRTAVAVEPRRSPLLIWGLAGAVTAAVIIAALFVPRAGRTAESVGHPEMPVPSAGSEGRAYVRQPATAHVPPLRAATRERSAVSREAEPEVIVQSGQLEALRDLAARLREGSVDASALPEKLIVSDDEEGVPWQQGV